MRIPTLGIVIPDSATFVHTMQDRRESENPYMPSTVPEMGVGQRMLLK